MSQDNLKMSIKETIQSRLDNLESAMKNQEHLSNPIKVLDIMSSISKFYSYVEEEDREYLEYCRYALEEKKEWNV